jgi:hypothetical protein
MKAILQCPDACKTINGMYKPHTEFIRAFEDNPNRIYDFEIHHIAKDHTWLNNKTVIWEHYIAMDWIIKMEEI